MIYEGIICTKRPNGTAHLSPLGYRLQRELVVLSPFVPSNTLDNIREQGIATLNFTDDVRVFAGCLTGRRDWPMQPAEKLDLSRLAECLGHWELEVLRELSDDVRPQFECRIVNRETHREFQGFNRAQAAVLEACILATRLDWLEPEKIRAEMRYLMIAVVKTAGENERCAWQWILEKIDSHPKHVGLQDFLQEKNE